MSSPELLWRSDTATRVGAGAGVRLAPALLGLVRVHLNVRIHLNTYESDEYAGSLGYMRCHKDQRGLPRQPGFVKDS